MKHRHFSLMFFTATLSLVPAAYGQLPTHTWVSGASGTDLGNCGGRSTPCLTFVRALERTAVNGEITVTDPGNFQGAVITKSITINADEQFAFVDNSGMSINIPVSASDPLRRVHLRNLNINGRGQNASIGTFTGISGIRFVNGSQLIVEDCLIQNFSQFGIDVNAPGSTARIAVSNTTISNVGLSAVRILAAGGSPRAVLRNLLIHKTAWGFDMSNGLGVLENSTISHVTNQAIVAQGTATINVNGGVVAHNGTGVAALSSGTVRIANLAILNNTTGISIGAGGTVASFGGNKNAGNSIPGAPNLNIPLQ